MRWATFEERLDSAARFSGLPRIAPQSLRAVATHVAGAAIVYGDGVQWLVLDSRAVMAAVSAITEDAQNG